MKRRRLVPPLATPGLSLALALVLFLAGCTREAAETSEAEAAQVEPMPAEEAALVGALAGPGEDGLEVLPIVLEAVGASGVEGRATAIPMGDSIQLNLMVQGLPREGEYQAHIHVGGCREGGAVVAALSPLVVEADGMGRSMTTVGADRLPPDGRRFVQVHGRAGVLACGDVHTRSEGGPASF